MYSFTDGSTLRIGTMYCIGRNYAAHAREMHARVPTDPIVFIKPRTAFAPDGSTILLPSFSSNVHHEVEVVAVIGADAENIPEADALSIVAGYGIGLDLTARDVQQRAKDHGEPWAVAKSWKNSAPLSAIVPRARSGDGPFTFSLDVNGVRRQHGTTAMMERSIPMLISYISSVFTLRAGDCIFTGTPEGVAQLVTGDEVVATLDGLVSLSIHVA